MCSLAYSVLVEICVSVFFLYVLNKYKSSKCNAGLVICKPQRIPSQDMDVNRMY